MKYTQPTDKAQIKKALTMLLMEHDTNLLQFCVDYNYTYHKIFQRLTRNSISHDLVNEMIHKLDTSKSLQRIKGKLVIV